jgi:hypothetical protein
VRLLGRDRREEVLLLLTWQYEEALPHLCVFVLLPSLNLTLRYLYRFRIREYNVLLRLLERGLPHGANGIIHAPLFRLDLLGRREYIVRLRLAVHDLDLVTRPLAIRSVFLMHIDIADKTLHVVGLSQEVLVVQVFGQFLIAFP